MFYSLHFPCTLHYQVAGYAVGGGHVLHMVCDLTIAADNAIFGQTGPKVVLSSSVSLVICRLRVLICRLDWL